MWGEDKGWIGHLAYQAFSWWANKSNTFLKNAYIFMSHKSSRSVAWLTLLNTSLFHLCSGCVMYLVKIEKVSLLTTGLWHALLHGPLVIFFTDMVLAQSYLFPLAWFSFFFFLNLRMKSGPEFLDYMINRQLHCGIMLSIAKIFNLGTFGLICLKNLLLFLAQFLCTSFSFPLHLLTIYSLRS